jgi:hypothetical protein
VWVPNPPRAHEQQDLIADLNEIASDSCRWSRRRVRACGHALSRCTTASHDSSRADRRPTFPDPAQSDGFALPQRSPAWTEKAARCPRYPVTTPNIAAARVIDRRESGATERGEGIVRFDVAFPRKRTAVRRYLSSGPPVAVSACALYLTVLSLYGERPCLAHAAINSCRGLGESTEPPKVTPPYAFGSTTTPAPHNGHSAFGERTTSGTSHSRRHSVRMLNGEDCTSGGASTHDSPLGSATDRQVCRATEVLQVSRGRRRAHFEQRFGVLAPVRVLSFIAGRRAPSSRRHWTPPRAMRWRGYWIRRARAGSRRPRRGRHLVGPAGLVR